MGPMTGLGKRWWIVIGWGITVSALRMLFAGRLNLLDEGGAGVEQSAYGRVRHSMLFMV